jgi:hypothetical protein
MKIYVAAMEALRAMEAFREKEKRMKLNLPPKLIWVPNYFIL